MNRPWTTAREPQPATKRAAANENAPSKKNKTTTQTTRMGGKRVRIVTTTKPDGTSKTKITDAPVLEWRLQAAIIRRLRKMAGGGRFAFAGDMNGLPLFSSQAKVRAKATGMTSGEHDVRVYLPFGRLGLIEIKGWEGSVFDEQRERHELLRGLGFTLQAIIFARTEDDAADQAEAIVRGWLADNQITT